MQVFETVHDILKFNGKKNPDKVTISVDEKDYTNGDLLKNVATLVEFLKKGEVSSGDRIAFLSKNSPEFIELMYASSILELVMVPINFRLAYEEVKFIIQDSGSKIIIFGEEFKKLVEKLNSEKTDLHLSLVFSTNFSIPSNRCLVVIGPNETFLSIPFPTLSFFVFSIIKFVKSFFLLS